MIKFFRHIRKKLLSENKFSKYLLYAIGEIILVVIGILIALQINNWNENKKERKLEQSTLIEIKNAMELDIQLLEEEIEHQLGNAQSATILLNHIKAKKPYSKKLDGLWVSVVYYFFVDFNTSAYKLLESRGIDIIKNEGLRQDVVDHYNIQQTRLQRSFRPSEHLSNEYIVYFFDRVYPDITADFQKTFDIKNESWAPKDYEALLNDPTLIPKISHNIKTRYRFLVMLEDFLKKQKILVKEIENELNK